MAPYRRVFVNYLACCGQVTVEYRETMRDVLTDPGAVLHGGDGLWNKGLDRDTARYMASGQIYAAESPSKCSWASYVILKSF